MNHLCAVEIRLEPKVQLEAVLERAIPENKDALEAPRTCAIGARVHATGAERCGPAESTLG